jgi:hypothetical protein
LLHLHFPLIQLWIFRLPGEPAFAMRLNFPIPARAAIARASLIPGAQIATHL